MGLRYNTFTGNFDLTRSPGSYLDGEVATYADLPLDTAAAPLNSAWLVRGASGLWLLSRKPAGIYIRTATTGVLDADYTYAGTFPDVFSDANFVVYDDADSTKNVKLDASAITTGTTRTLTVPNKSGTICTTDAADLTSGTLADARLSSNVPLKDAANTFTQNQTLNGTNNVMPNQTTAASDSSLMTRALVRDESFFMLGSNFFPRSFAFGNTGAGSSAAAVAGDHRLAFMNSGTATSGFGRVTVSRGLNNTSGGGIRFGGFVIGGATRVVYNLNSSSGALDNRIRFIVGGNGGTPATADNDALSVVGFGWEIRSVVGGQEWRLFAHNGTSFTGGAWQSATVSSFTLVPVYLSVVSNGSGSVTGYFAVEGSRTLSSSTISGGPTTSGNATNNYVDFVVVNSSTGTPVSVSNVGLCEVQIICRAS